MGNIFCGGVSTEKSDAFSRILCGNGKIFEEHEKTIIQHDNAPDCVHTEDYIIAQSEIKSIPLSQASPVTDVETLSFSSFSSEKFHAYIKKEMFFKLVDPLTKKRALNPQDHPYINWICLVERDAVSCVGCLLADGSIFTALHAVFDFEANAWVDFSRIFITFVQNQKIFTYRCARVLQHGIVSFNSEVFPFDYVRILVDGQPLKTLGGGLKLDPKSHYFGTVGNKEPNVLRAISGPILRTDGRSLTITQFTSEAKNIPPSSFYEQQETIQMTAWAFSGQHAMLLPNSTIIYAIYGGANSPSARKFGVKVSEFRAAHKRAISSPPTQGRLFGEQQRERLPQDRFRDSYLLEIRQYIRDEMLLDINRMKLFLDEMKYVLDFKPVYYEWQCILPVNFRDLKCMNIEEQTKYLLTGKDTMARGLSHFANVLMKADKSLYILHALTHCMHFIVDEFTHHHFNKEEGGINLHNSFNDSTANGTWLNSDGDSGNLISNDSSFSFSSSSSRPLKRESFNWGNSSFTSSVSSPPTNGNNGDGSNNLNNSLSSILDSIEEIEVEDDNSDDEPQLRTSTSSSRPSNTLSIMNLTSSSKAQVEQEPIYLIDLEVEIGLDYLTTPTRSLPCQHVQLIGYRQHKYYILPVRLERFNNESYQSNPPIIINAKQLLQQAQQRLETLKLLQQQQEQQQQQSLSSSSSVAIGGSGKVAMRRRLSRRSSASNTKTGEAMSLSGRFSLAPEASLVVTATGTVSSNDSGVISSADDGGRMGTPTFQTF